MADTHASGGPATGGEPHAHSAHGGAAGRDPGRAHGRAPGRDHGPVPGPGHGQDRGADRDTADHPHGHGPAHRHGDEDGHDHGSGRAPADHGPGHAHGPAGGRWARVRHRVGHVVTPHAHESAAKVDPAMEASREGMRTLWISLVVLGVTTLVQAVIVGLSGSVALLGDTVHNATDALTAVPLGIAFLLGRRAANRRYTYGYGRAEDLAGIFIVVAIAASAALAAWAAVDRLLDPREVTHLWAVAAAAAAGFAGNEWVARYRIRTGRRIGSAALVADGLHARTDGFTSLAVLLGAGGAALGLRWADPVVGLAITAAILLVLRDAAREIFRRLMDSVDPALVQAAERALGEVPGVLGVGPVRMRWIGHALRAEAELVVAPHLTVVAAHEVAVAAEHALIHTVPRLTAATVHIDHTATGPDPHAALAHHAHRDRHARAA
ncbi:cation diffusion facilitator family transporter [Streptomyces sp. DSM 44917]|uniref:Cation diffusion facilitator family transporter n=1 Tax=Streptomyces boetiae TaxID=3075541 RepID=A0ABU2LCE4_9ACTN|nr:cation diffusion facilitator family transporter [Streptomyces sp. DSM 44917]MDT0309239.1 cation diffusion facilitator family transporter [Streptomyces sp. DSM 44917]